MNIAKTMDGYFKWQIELNWAKKICLSFLFAAITGIFAQIRIPLPWTPVPVTGQVFAVLLSGILLGSLYAGLSMIFYLGFGALGVPWFAGFRSGLLPGPTLGYLVGFVPAAIFVGIFVHKERGLIRRLLVMIVGILIIYFIGGLNFAVVMKTNLTATLKMAVLPFIPFDIAKAIVVGFIARVILPDEHH